MMYIGEREAIPEEYAEAVALIDASDDKCVDGVGNRKIFHANDPADWDRKVCNYYLGGCLVLGG